MYLYLYIEGRLRSLAVACWTTDHSLSPVLESRRGHIFASLPLKVARPIQPTMCPKVAVKHQSSSSSSIQRLCSVNVLPEVGDVLCFLKLWYIYRKHNIQKYIYPHCKLSTILVSFRVLIGVKVQLLAVCVGSIIDHLIYNVDHLCGRMGRMWDYLAQVMVILYGRSGVRIPAVALEFACHNLRGFVRLCLINLSINQLNVI